MICYCQLVVKVGDILAHLGANDLLFDCDCLMNQFFSATVLLLLAQLDSNALHSPRFFLCCRRICAFSAKLAPSAQAIPPVIDNAGAAGFDRERF
mmetsp:Transcript_11277/g.15190  ORF Transcript_11277/g.15190 Transcript_11277/m.15190 type:complete len:95 (+) Transcript_11277:1191-1475(+)